MVYRGEVLPGVRAKARPILSVQQLEAVRAVFARPERYRCKPQAPRGLLDRVAICATCGAPMRMRINTKRRRQDGVTSRFRTYCCPGTAAGHSSIVADIADRSVTDAVSEILAGIERDPRGASATAVDGATVHLALDELQDRECRLLQAVQKGLLPDAMIRSTLASIEVDRARITSHAADQELRVAPEREPAEVRERFLRQLPIAKVEHWPSWFTAAHPDLADGVLRHQLRKAFLAEPLPVQQAVIRATVKVVISPHTGRGERLQITRL